MEREDSLDAFAAHDASDCEGLVDSSSSAGNDGSGEHLGADLFAFFDSATYVDGVADLEMWDVLFQTFIFDSVQQFSFHCIFS